MLQASSNDESMQPASVGSSVGIHYSALYKFMMADLSQVCDAKSREQVDILRKLINDSEACQDTPDLDEESFHSSYDSLGSNNSLLNTDILKTPSFFQLFDAQIRELEDKPRHDDVIHDELSRGVNTEAKPAPSMSTYMPRSRRRHSATIQSSHDCDMLPDEQLRRSSYSEYEEINRAKSKSLEYGSIKRKKSYPRHRCKEKNENLSSIMRPPRYSYVGTTSSKQTNSDHILSMKKWMELMDSKLSGESEESGHMRKRESNWIASGVEFSSHVEVYMLLRDP